MLDVSTGSRAISLSPARSEPERRFSWQRRRFPWKSIRQHWLAFLSGGVLAFAILAALFAPAIAPHDPNVISMTETLQGPSSDHLLGTDQLGRDHLSRLIYGGGKTLTMAGIAMLGTVALGLFFGVVAGYFGGAVDLVITQVLNILLSLPSLLLALAILGVLGPGTSSLLLALIAAGWVGHARIFRAAVLAVREQVYVEAAVSIGASPSGSLGGICCRTSSRPSPCWRRWISAS